jgi:hypothetical protein
VGVETAAKISTTVQNMTIINQANQHLDTNTYKGLYQPVKKFLWLFADISV